MYVCMYMSVHIDTVVEKGEEKLHIKRCLKTLRDVCIAACRR